MSVTAQLVKELRQRTGAGMMECKKALVESQSDIEKATQLLREKGAASAEKKAGRITAEGKIILNISDGEKIGTLVEINCETDFVARDASFENFADSIVQFISTSKPETLDDLYNGVLKGGEKIEDAKNALISILGENLAVRRFERIEAEEGVVYGYLHGRKIGVLVSVVNGTEQLGRDLAMQIAASNPISIYESQISRQKLEEERKIFTTQAKETGKPDPVVEKIVEGKMRKFISENTLLGQQFVKDTQLTVGQVLESSSSTVESFIRYELGEGLQKRTDDFVGEVLAQAAGN